MKVNFWQILGIAIIVIAAVLWARRSANAPTTGTNPGTAASTAPAK